jgi:hypothetical protein
MNFLKDVILQDKRQLLLMVAIGMAGKKLIVMEIKFLTTNE